MAKYIVDIANPNVRNEYIVYWTYDGLEVKRVSDLTPYTEPDTEQVRKEAYEQGRKVGIKDGMCEAWETARKVTQVRKYGGYGDCLEEVFGRHRVPWDVFDYSASEAIEKIRQYEQEKEEIHLWDEVINGRNFKGTVFNIEDNGMLTIFGQDGTWTMSHARYWKKTGRHFHEIAEVLQKMKESDNG